MDTIGYVLADSLKDYVKTIWGDLSYSSLFGYNTYHAGIIVNGIAYYIDGAKSSSSNNKVYAYNFASKTFQNLYDSNALATSFGGGFCVSKDNFIYIVGSMNIKGGENRFTILKYDIAHNTMSVEYLHNDTTYDMIYASGVIKDNSIYITNIGNPGTNIFLRYDILNKSLTALANMNTARYRGACTLKDNYIYVFGGMNSNGVLKSCEKYSISNNVWTAIADLPIESNNNFAFLMNNKIHVILATDTDQHVVYSEVNNSFIKDTPTNKNINNWSADGRTMAFAIGNNIMTIFGSSNFNKVHYILKDGIQNLNNLKAYLATN